MVYVYMYMYGLDIASTHDASMSYNGPFIVIVTKNGRLSNKNTLEH